MNKNWKEFLEEEQIEQKRMEQINNLASSTLTEMIKLGFTNKEYEQFKNYMDKQLKNFKITR